MQGWLKGQSHILKIAIMVPRKRLSRAIAATFAPHPRGPNVKNTSPETLSYISLCTYVSPYIYLLKFLMNDWFSCCFEIMITPGGGG